MTALPGTAALHLQYPRLTELKSSPYVVRVGTVLDFFPAAQTLLSGDAHRSWAQLVLHADYNRQARAP